MSSSMLKVSQQNPRLNAFRNRLSSHFVTACAGYELSERLLL